MNQPHRTQASAVQRSIAQISTRLARTITPKGPRVSVDQARDVVGQLRVLAPVSAEQVHRLTGLTAAQNLTSAVRVVDRPAWTEAATRSFLAMGADALTRSLEGKPDSQAAAAQVFSGLQLGTLLSFISTRILGQFDPFASSPTGFPQSVGNGAENLSGSARIPTLSERGAAQGELLLVAPNIAQVAADLNVDQHDFSLWVLLHEQTHRVQFAQAPWIAEHMQERVGELMDSVMERSERMSQGQMSQSVAELRAALIRARANKREGAALNEVFMTDAEKEIVSELTGIMSLLEGHANVIMDSVDAELVPSIKTIRRRFTARAADRTRIEKLVFRWLGMEKKAAQYRDGQKFVQHLVDAHGMERFNTVFERLEHLPTEAEIHDPDAWARRVLGTSSAGTDQGSAVSGPDQHAPNRDLLRGGGPELRAPRAQGASASAPGDNVARPVSE